jgi:uncharacterized protein (TIGR03084 family)
MSEFTDLLDDHEAEHHDLLRIVKPLAGDAKEWDLMTPAEGWAVRDQISHLAYFDAAAHLAITEPQKFALMAEAFMAQTGDPMEGHLIRGRSMTGDELVDWWETAHGGMAEAFAVADPRMRVPWFGPPMGAMSFVSARLMETWAHGQDVVDALGAERTPTNRLRHVAHIGVRARPFSYMNSGLELPRGKIDVVLVAPSDEEWIWEIGEAIEGEPVSSVTGPAEDFCLLVTQRRNIVDTSLIVSGRQAQGWLSIAQAFAGPPGGGRPPIG